MKRLFFVQLMVLGLAGYGTAQTNPEHFSFIVFVKDTAAIQATPSLNHINMSSNNPGVQSVFNNYTVYKYEQSTPDSRYPVMRQYYLIEASSLNLMSDLLAYPSLIASGREVPKVLPTYTPSDYYSPWADGSKDLEFVHAPEAWNVTQGNPDILIGINDTRFETSHPDLIGKIVDSFSNYSGTNDHGTGVAGYAAGRTDNGDTGLAAIGFNCRMVISTNCTTPGLLTMSNANLRVLNASWASMTPALGDCDSPYTSAHFQQQVNMNEVYENGTIPFFGAGNSSAWNNSCGISGVNDTFDNRGFVFPASLDHCMSISSVGHSVPVGTMYLDGNGNLIPLHWEKVHRSIADSPLTAHHHNSRVDLVAPGYGLHVLTTAANGYYKNDDGTSFASPMCAGTAALMLSVPIQGIPNSTHECLSPYQIEWVMKHTADASIYNVTYNGQNLNAEYQGRLGAGLLNARACVEYVRDHDVCNNSALQTFNIKGVELNTICAPGFSSNDVKPHLVSILENGTPPYTYRWEAYPDNEATLDNYAIADPTIINASGTYLAHFYLTVYDNSPIQKVANKIIRIQLRTSGWDLASRDLYMDMLDEPNTMSTYDPRTYNVWKSPDIWNRWEADDQYGMQKPEYFTTDSNYLYVRVRNVGCEAAPATAKLQLYWTVASTTEHWKTDWDSTALFPGTSLPLGKMITPSSGLSIPALQPGASVNIRRGWRAPDPDDYYPGIDHMETCFLARIEQSTSSPYGMTIPELTNMPVSINVINNNNVATHNTWSTDFLQGNQHFYIMVGGVPAFPANTTYTLQLVNDKYINKHFAGDLSSVISTTVTLDKTVYNRWKAGGFKGTYANKNDATYQVTFDGMNMELQHIELKNMELFPVKISFKLINGAETTDYTYTVHFRQIAEIKSLHNPIVGNGSYELNTKASSPQQRPSPGETGKAAKGAYSVYPNPTHDMISVIYEGARKEVTLQLADLAGRVLLTKQGQIDLAPLQLSLAPLPAGMYILTVKDQSGATEQFKVVKQ